MQRRTMIPCDRSAAMRYIVLASSRRFSVCCLRTAGRSSPPISSASAQTLAGSTLPAADGERAKADRRPAASHGHALPMLAADDVDKCDVVADGVKGAQGDVGTSGDDCAADRSHDTTVVDQVALAHPEHEFARLGVDLACTQPAGEQSRLCIAYDVVWVGIRSKHDEIAHARRRRAGEGTP